MNRPLTKPRRKLQPASVSLRWRRRISRRARAEALALVRQAFPGCTLRDGPTHLSLLYPARQTLRLTLLYLMTEAWTALG